VAKMLSQDEINPFNNPSMSGYRLHEGIAPWHELLCARRFDHLCGVSPLTEIPHMPRLVL
jgi:hypothetical protein